MTHESPQGRYAIMTLLLPTGMRYLLVGHPTYELIGWALAFVTLLSLITGVSLIARFFINIYVKHQEVL